MTIGLFDAVGQWNTFMRTVLYVRDANLQPLQVVSRDLMTVRHCVLLDSVKE